MVEEIISYKASTGKIFNSRKEAEEEEDIARIERFIDDLCDDPYERGFAEYLYYNKETLIEFLKGM